MLMQTNKMKWRIRGHRRFALICAFLFFLLNISSGSGSVPSYGVPVPLGTPTYDSRGQVVHPDVLYVPDGFGPEKWPYWMAMTPYPNGNDAYENPSILVMRRTTLDGSHRFEKPLGQ